MLGMIGGTSEHFRLHKWTAGGYFTLHYPTDALKNKMWLFQEDQGFYKGDFSGNRFHFLITFSDKYHSRVEVKYIDFLEAEGRVIICGASSPLNHVLASMLELLLM